MRARGAPSHASGFSQQRAVTLCVRAQRPAVVRVGLVDGGPLLKDINKPSVTEINIALDCLSLALEASASSNRYWNLEIADGTHIPALLAQSAFLIGGKSFHVFSPPQLTLVTDADGQPKIDVAADDVRAAVNLALGISVTVDGSHAAGSSVFTCDTIEQAKELQSKSFMLKRVKCRFAAAALGSPAAATAAVPIAPTVPIAPAVPIAPTVPIAPATAPVVAAPAANPAATPTAKFRMSIVHDAENCFIPKDRDSFDINGSTLYTNTVRAILNAVGGGSATDSSVATTHVEWQFVLHDNKSGNASRYQPTRGTLKDLTDRGVTHVKPSDKPNSVDMKVKEIISSWIHNFQSLKDEVRSSQVHVLRAPTTSLTLRWCRCSS